MKYKKLKERIILNHVYYESRFQLIDEDSEQPDFKIKDKNFDINFGVEITELYKNQISAKKKNAYQYKCGILRKPTKDEYIHMLEDRVGDKNVKIEKYDKTLDYINLIIYDMEEGFFSFSMNEILEMIEHGSLRENILSSKFNEIFVVSKKSDISRALPLKLSIILEEISLIKILMERNGDYQENDILEMLYKDLYSKGVRDMEFVKTNDGKGVKIIDYIISDSGRIIRKASHEEYVKIKKYFDSTPEVTGGILKNFKQESSVVNIYPPMLL